MNYYKKLPEEYKIIKVMDASKKSTGIWLNVVAFLLAVLVATPILLLKRPTFEWKEYGTFLLFAVALFAYIVLHELLHGLFYKIFTHEKLKFGFTFSCAYCGVPTLYIKKIPMIITCLAPFVIFSILSIIGISLLPPSTACFLLIIGFSLHVGGCCGDLYCCWLLLKMDKDTLINDTGAKQTFYSK